MLEFHPDIKEVHVVNLKKAKKKKSLFMLLNDLRRIRKLSPYDLVIDMQGLIKSAIISRIISYTVTLGFDKFSIRENIASIFYNKTFKFDYGKNVIERNFELIKFALELPFNREEIHHKLPFLHSSQQHLTPSLSNIKKNILLIPGASHLSKCYPVSKLSKLTTLIDANFLIIWGNQNEKIMADEIKALSPQVKVCDKLSLSILISLINEVDLVIGPDTGPTHMAWALNRPSITIFGPTPSYRNTYVTDINQVIESNSSVNPYKIDKKDDSIKDISVEKILQIANKLLKL